MPTGSGKSTLFKHIYNLLQLTRELCGQGERDPVWAIDDATFEKMGVLMSRNSAVIGHLRRVGRIPDPNQLVPWMRTKRFTRTFPLPPTI